MGLKIEIKNIHCKTLPNTETVLYQVPANKRAIIRSMQIVNGADTNRCLNLRILKGGSYARLTCYNFGLLGRHHLDFDDPITLEAGDKILGYADLKDVVSVKINGVEEDK